MSTILQNHQDTFTREALLRHREEEAERLRKKKKKSKSK
jgi:hypothetical protein